MVAFLWLVEFSLEAMGAYLALRRRCWPLFSLLAFLSFSDLAGGIIGLYCDGNTLGIVGWWQSGVKYALLVVLACWLCGKFFHAENSAHARLIVATITLLGTAIVVKVFSDGSSLIDRLKDAESAANIFVCMALALGWIMRTAYLKQPWNLVTAALLLLVISDLGFTALEAWKLYPLGAIPAYALWCWALRKEEPQEWQVRLPLEQRAERLVDEEIENRMVI